MPLLISFWAVLNVKLDTFLHYCSLSASTRGHSDNVETLWTTKKYPSIHQLIITLKHSDRMDKGTRNPKRKKNVKNHNACVCPSLIPRSGWLIPTVQYCHVEMASLIDVPAPHIFHSHWQIIHNSAALVSFLSSPTYNTPWTMVLVSDLFINFS